MGCKGILLTIAVATLGLTLHSRCNEEKYQQTTDSTNGLLTVSSHETYTAPSVQPKKGTIYIETEHISLDELRKDPFIVGQKESVRRFIVEEKNRAQYLCISPSGGRVYINEGDTRVFDYRGGKVTITGGVNEHCEENSLRDFFDGEYFLNTILSGYEYLDMRDTPMATRRWADPIGDSVSLREKIQEYSLEEQRRILEGFDNEYREIIKEELSLWRDDNPTNVQTEIIECMEEELDRREYTINGFPVAFKLYTCLP